MCGWHVYGAMRGARLVFEVNRGETSICVCIPIYTSMHGSSDVRIGCLHVCTEQR